MNRTLLSIVIAALFSSCNYSPCIKNNCSDQSSLDAWNDTSKDQYNFIIIDSIKSYVKAVTACCDKDSLYFIPKEDRIAVFDMDGTIACERPSSMELICAYTMAYHTRPECDTDVKKKMRKHQVTIKNNLLGADSDSLVAVIKENTDTIHNLCIPTKGIPDHRILANQFYKPMVQLINYLKENDFDVYIVSGSSQQFIWVIIENVEEIDFKRSNLIGSLSNYDSVEYTKGKGSKFRLNNNEYWNNSGRGKAISIYNRIGKMPVFAFGNTVHDFDMFALTSSNNNTFTKTDDTVPHTYPTMCCLLNHNDSTFEDQYDPYDPTSLVQHDWKSYTNNTVKWENPIIFDTIMSNHNWIKVNMSKNFKKNSVFIEK